LHRFQKCNDYYCETCKFSWIKCQKCLHIQFVSQFSHIQWSIYPYLPGIKHSYFICILSMWLVITWWSLTWSLIHICWILAVKVDPCWKGGVKEKIFPKKAHKNITFLLPSLIEDISVDKCSKNPNGFFVLRSLPYSKIWSISKAHRGTSRHALLRIDISVTVRPTLMILFFHVQFLP